jgi:DedD protein
MGYTSGTAMEDRGLRDIERWRDKIEVRLDNRQVFFLFFGSALVACMLFVLGVIVGKRLESRGRAVSPEIEDPLALLDKVATTPRPLQTGVTFPQALFGTAGKPAATDKNAKKAQPQEASPNGPASSGKKTEGVKAVALVDPEPKPVPAAAKPDPAPMRMSASKAGTATTEAKAEAKVAEAAPVQKAGEIAAKAGEAKDGKSVAIPTVAGGDGKGKARFALQLSSFQDKAEAEAFAQKFEGERPYMVVSEIPGKGTWYRVRVGDYATSKDALAAKQTFEKKHSVIAYVAQK